MMEINFIVLALASLFFSCTERGTDKGTELTRAEATTTELYNIAEDPSEESNLAEKHPDIASELSVIMDSARNESPVYKFLYIQ